MATFVDKAGRTWAVELTLGTLGDARRAGIELGKLLASESELLTLLYGDDLERLGRLLWVLCEKQAVAANLDPDAFAALFDAATLDAARLAIVGAIADFSPSRKTAQTFRDHLPAVIARADAEAAAILAAKMQDRLSPTLKPTVGNSPGPPASAIPGP